ncbi:DNA-processing protein DprA [Mycobacterium sp.]|uniref:DNA-processing protein DprA n=1 Tax=Mycobacterium sp. TaxID=1785 RepID=UPI003340638E
MGVRGTHYSNSATSANRLADTIPAAHSIAVVGSREASLGALDDAYQLGHELAARGVAVISGLAAGVDTHAHRGALDAGGMTVAVLGTGIRRVFPAENQSLTESIRRDGVLVSQFAPDAPRTGTTFLLRNHVIAGMSQASLVMDGRSRSGSRYEVEQAIGYGRLALLWEPSLGSEQWTQQLVESGQASFVSSTASVLSMLGAPV